jgi:hypothetical protein
MTSTRVKAKYAAQIRAGILEARQLFPAYHLLTRLGKRAFSRETSNYLKQILKGAVKFQLFSV